MHTIKEIFDDIVLLANILEENAIDCFKFPKGIEIEKIEEWEKANSVILPQGYKEFIALANGFGYWHGAEIFPLDGVEEVEIIEEFKGYYCIGSYIGDGSMILTDKNGEFYYGDHGFGEIKKADFSEFLLNEILDYMKDSCKEYNIEIPDEINVK